MTLDIVKNNGLFAIKTLRQRVWGVLALTLLLPACMTTNPATGKQEFTPFMSPAQEQALGQQAHPQVMAEQGGVYENDKIGGYVAAIGGRLAANSEMKDQPFTFTVLNTPIVNAFALPGGYIYVTRGILALFNDEAEMASVLGHEIGHVTARHTAKRYNQQIFTGLLAGVAGAAIGNAQVAEALNYGGQLYLLGYSRDQEYQSDKLGVRYMSRTGYDPYAAADMLDSLQRQDALQDLIAKREKSSRPPEFFSTHPNTADRSARADAAAAKTGISQGGKPRHRDAYLQAIDGMLYGDDPAQGFIRGRMFWHGPLRLTFTAPENFLLLNTSEMVVGQGTGPAAGAAFAFSGGDLSSQNNALAAYCSSVWQKYTGGKATAQEMQQVHINGMTALTGVAIGQSKQGNVLVRLLAVQYSPEKAYHFFMIVPEALQASLGDDMKRLTYSFRKLTTDEADDVKPLRIKIATVQRGDTPTSLARYMAFDKYKLERFLTLNGLSERSILKAGQKVKLVVEEK